MGFTFGQLMCCILTFQQHFAYTGYEMRRREKKKAKSSHVTTDVPTDQLKTMIIQILKRYKRDNITPRVVSTDLIRGINVL